MTRFAHDNSMRPVRPPVIILGAARSGTKLLRSLIAAAGSYAEVPFDVNYIWRYHNESCEHDALPVDLLTERTRAFIRSWLPRCAKRRFVQLATREMPFAAEAAGASAASFVEKTVSNILRIPFVYRVFPNAKFVAIVRDGRDVVESAERCWRDPPQASYLLAKMRTFPWHRCAPYGWKYAVGLVRQRLGLAAHMGSWGPRYPGIDDDLRHGTLLEVCAQQWRACIEHYEQSRPLIPPNQLCELRYEDLVSTPQDQIHLLCDFLEIRDRCAALRFGSQSISRGRTGSAQRLSAVESKRVRNIIGPALERWGYATEPAAIAA